MILKYLAFVIFVCYASGDETMPAEQLELFLGDVLDTVRQSDRLNRRFQDFNYLVKDVILGVPIELGFVTKNATLHGPSSVTRESPVVGTQLLSGTAVVKTKLKLNSVSISYSYLLIDLFGLSYDGSAEISVVNPTIDVTIHVYRNVLTRCQVTASVSKPLGQIIMTLYDTSGFFRLVSGLVQYILTTLFSSSMITEKLFPDVTDDLEMAITDAARKIACR